MSNDNEIREMEGRRLLLVRLALGYSTAASFCREFGVGIDAQSSYENGIRTIPRSLIRDLKGRHAVSADWLINNDPAYMPQGLLLKTKEILENPNWMVPKRGPTSKRKRLQNNKK